MGADSAGQRADVRPSPGPGELLQAAIVEVAGERGYGESTVALIAARAGMSRSSFYEHFEDKQACFLAALAEIETQLLATASQAVAAGPPAQAAVAVVGALVEFARSAPAPARVFMGESMAAGAAALDAREQATGRLAELIESAYRELPESAVTPDLPGEILAGCVFRLLASRLRRAESPRGLEVELAAWVASYERPLGEHRWRLVTERPPPPRSAFLRDVPLRRPAALPASRARRSGGAAADNQRLRIVFATAELVSEVGFLQVSVAEICRRAGVGSRAFYSLFTDTRDVFMAVHELAFQRAMAATAGAFFSVADWPARLWEAARAFTQLVDQEAALSRPSLVESHAAGAAAAERMEELILGFTIFLEEGYEHRGDGERDRGAPSKLALESIAASSFEMLAREARRAPGCSAGLLGALCFLALAPFVGSQRSGELVEGFIEADEQASV